MVHRYLRLRPHGKHDGSLAALVPALRSTSLKTRTHASHGSHLLPLRMLPMLPNSPHASHPPAFALRDFSRSSGESGPFNLDRVKWDPVHRSIVTTSSKQLSVVCSCHTSFLPHFVPARTSFCCLGRPCASVVLAPARSAVAFLPRDVVDPPAFY